MGWYLVIGVINMVSQSLLQEAKMNVNQHCGLLLYSARYILVLDKRSCHDRAYRLVSGSFPPAAIGTDGAAGGAAASKKQHDHCSVWNRTPSSSS